jgi:hypothetical protein
VSIRPALGINGILPAPYYADLEVREELGIIEEGGAKTRIVPDVTVLRHPHPPRELGGGAVVARPRRDLSRSVEVIVHLDRIDHAFIEIRDPSRGHKLITLIEILSPSNKRRGPDRKAYARKQHEVLESDASLIEVDLLRGGRRLVRELSLEATIHALNPPPAYLVLVNRAWRRDRGAVAYQVFPVSLRQCLPCISVPLKMGEEEVPLDLQFVFDRAYDGGPYRRGAVDYSSPPPDPSLSADDAAWAAELTRPWREPLLAGPGS